MTLDPSTSQVHDEDYSDPDYLPASYRGTGMPDELSEAGQRILQCQMEPPEAPPAPLTRENVKDILASEWPGVPFRVSEWHHEYVSIGNARLQEIHQYEISRIVSRKVWVASDWRSCLELVRKDFCVHGVSA